MAVEGEVKFGEEANLVKIVTKNIIEKYHSDAKVLKEAAKILKGSRHVPVETIKSVRDAYTALKEKDYACVLQ